MDTIHRCTEKACPFVGQVTSKSCRCHKTAEQMLQERVAELEAALRKTTGELRDLRAMVYGECPSLLEDHFSAPNIDDAIESGDAALANAGA